MGWIFENRASVILYNLFLSSLPDKTWLIPANICDVVVATLIKSKRPFELVDIDHGYGINLTTCRELIQRNHGQYSGILVVDPYGAPQSIDEQLNDLKSLEPGLAIILDKCLGKPTFEMPSNKSVDVVLYSTGYAKFVDIGYGGAAWIRNTHYPRVTGTFEELAWQQLDTSMKVMQTFEQSNPLFHGDWLPLQPVEFPIDSYRKQVSTELKRAEGHKARLNDIYFKEIASPECCLPEEFSLWRFQIVVNEPAVLIQSLRENNLFASRHYAPVRVSGSTDCLSAGWLAQHVINLFNDRYYTPDQAIATINIVNRHLDRFGIPERRDRQQQTE